MKIAAIRHCFCLLIFAWINLTNAFPHFCVYNQADEVIEEKKCNFGWDVDPCGIKVCAKGRYNFFNIDTTANFQALISLAEIVQKLEFYFEAFHSFSFFLNKL